MNKAFTKPYPDGWENLPEETTPISADVMNAYDSAIDEIDNRIISKDEKYGDNAINLGRKDNSAVGTKSVAIGTDTIASKTHACAIGYKVVASGNYSHAEGSESAATGSCSHAEGNTTYANGSNSHSEGYNTYANGNNSHAEGQQTKAVGVAQHVQGKFNVESSQFAHIIGGGTSNSDKKNIHTVDWQGNAVYEGTVQSKGSKYVDENNNIHELNIRNNKLLLNDEEVGGIDPDIYSEMNGTTFDVTGLSKIYLTEKPSTEFDVTFTSGGKNIFNWDLFQNGSSDGCTITKRNNGSFYISGEPDNYYAIEILGTVQLTHAESLQVINKAGFYTLSQKLEGDVLNTSVLMKITANSEERTYITENSKDYYDETYRAEAIKTFEITQADLSADDFAIEMQIRVLKAAWGNYVPNTLYPMLEYGSTASDFEKYTGNTNESITVNPSDIVIEIPENATEMTSPETITIIYANNDLGQKVIDLLAKNNNSSSQTRVIEITNETYGITLKGKVNSDNLFVGALYGTITTQMPSGWEDLFELPNGYIIDLTDFIVIGQSHINSKTFKVSFVVNSSNKTRIQFLGQLSAGDVIYQQLCFYLEGA